MQIIHYLLNKACHLWNIYAKAKNEAWFRHVNTDSKARTTSCGRKKKNTSQGDGRYEKMLLPILDYLIWLVAAGSSILWERIVTFMAGRRPSKGLRAWQKHRDGDGNWGQDNAGADWVWDLWELVKPCGASVGFGFCLCLCTVAFMVSLLCFYTSK